MCVSGACRVETSRPARPANYVKEPHSGTQVRQLTRLEGTNQIARLEDALGDNKQHDTNLSGETQDSQGLIVVFWVIYWGVACYGGQSDEEHHIDARPRVKDGAGKLSPFFCQNIPGSQR